MGRNRAAVALGALALCVLTLYAVAVCAIATDGAQGTPLLAQGSEPLGNHTAGNGSANPLNANGTNPAPEYIWDDIWNSIRNLPGAIWGWIIGAFNGAVNGIINAIFGLFGTLFKSPQLVGNVPLYNLWLKVVLIMDALIGLVFVGIGIMYLFSGLKPGFRASVKLMMPNLFIFMIIGHSSIYICQFVLDLNDAMVEAVLGGGIEQYQPVMPPGTGIALCILFIVVLVLVVLVGMILALRVVIIMFSAVLMPVACLCYIFPATRGFAKNLVSMFAVWTFLTFLESIVLVVAFIALGTAGGWVAWLIFVATLVFMTMLPKMVGKGLGDSAPSGSFLGVGSIAGAGGMLITGIGAGVAGAAGAVARADRLGSVAGMGPSGQFAHAIAGIPGGFARGFAGSIKRGPVGGMVRAPLNSYRNERDDIGSSSGEVGRIRREYSLS
jgi:hypothetical protein